MADDSVRYDERHGIVIVEAPAHVTAGILDDYRARLMNLPEFSTGTPILVDWSAIDQRGVTSELVRDRASHPWPVTTRIAFYAPTDVLFGLARMYALQSQQQIETFRTREDAVAWLTRPGG